LNKSRIEWCDYTWNPIKGLCPVGCWYCYARKIYKRFGWDSNPSLPYGEWKEPRRLGNSHRIFVCSTFELFHPIADKWRDDIFWVIEKSTKHTFIILTKMPERIDRPMPPNVWLGVSVTNQEDADIRTPLLKQAEARTKFISAEPLLAPMSLDHCGLGLVIVGRLTGHGHQRDPKREWIEDIVDSMGMSNIFLKDNLRKIWGKSLIQEFPK
jgi:protein gp37